MERMPGGCGIGLRREHYGAVLSGRAEVPWFEAISENFMIPGGRPRHVLERVRADYPVALHGVSLSIGSAEPVGLDYLARLKSLVEWIEPAIVSDHLCWTGLGGHNSHDLLPLPFTTEAVRNTASKVRRVQDALGRPILLENISSYVEYRDSEMAEWEFVAAVADEADCFLLLDVNNVYVNARNHGFDPGRYLEGLPVGRVRQFHLAGHEDHQEFVIDTHDSPICDPVWALFRRAVERFGPQPTLIERDANVPPLEELLAEARRAEAVLQAREELIRV
jgi:uncharacterized protein (UPF0276 family)